MNEFLKAARDQNRPKTWEGCAFSASLFYVLGQVPVGSGALFEVLRRLQELQDGGKIGFDFFLALQEPLKKKHFYRKEWVGFLVHLGRAQTINIKSYVIVLCYNHGASFYFGLLLAMFFRVYTDGLGSRFLAILGRVLRLSW